MDQRHAVRICRVLVVALFCGLGVTQSQAAAIRNLSGITSNSLPRNDDGSTGVVSIGFPINFYGQTYSNCFVNNNGNITFDSALSDFTPFGLTGTAVRIIAPFFADVDTRANESDVVKYGRALLSGRKVFGVNWINVGYFGSHADRLNSFQLLIVNRSDIRTGDFDMEFNYNQIQWEAGDASGGNGGLGGEPARAGFSNGSGQSGTWYEFPGSGVRGGFLDGNATTSLSGHSLRSTVPGRYVFRVRNGVPEFEGVDMTKKVDISPIAIGSNLTYQVSIKNNGTTTLSGLSLVDTLPTSMTYVSGIVSNGEGTCFLASNTVTCSLTDLPTNNSRQVSIVVSPTRLGEYCNTAKLTSTNGGAASAEVCSMVLPPRTHGLCITRPARYWFRHVQNNDFECATLYAAVQTIGERLGLGFMNLPTDFRNGDSVIGAADATLEALGLYWRKNSRVGDPDGTQSDRVPASKLCRARKSLAVEMIAAQANFLYLGTYPTDCPSADNSFTVEIIEDARKACEGTDLNEIKTQTSRLRRYNSSGITQDFSADLYGRYECDPQPTKLLRQASRDPSLSASCPSLNDTCESAEVITAFMLPYKATIDLRKYHDDIADPECMRDGSTGGGNGTNNVNGSTNSVPGGADAVWKIDEATAAAGRHFVISTQGSNFPTMISVWSGDCDGLDPVACASSAPSPDRQPQVVFTTDGSSTYYIVIEGVDGAVGKLRMKVISY